MNTAAMVRLLSFANGGRKELTRFGLTTRSDASRVREALLHVGIPWLAARLAEENPVAIVRTRPAISRLDAMRAEFSSVIVCLRHPAALANLGAAADLLLERGHAWLGEPLALWLVDERENAVDLLLERVPVLDIYADWDLEDTFDRADTLARSRLAQETKTYWFGTWPPERPLLMEDGWAKLHRPDLGQVVVLSNPTSDDFYSRLAEYNRQRFTRASEP
jgi:hypothetical protein